MSSEQLRDLLQEQAKKLSDEAVESDGQVSDDQVEKLERLAQIVEICEKTKPPKARRRWPVGVILGITLLIVLGLFSVRIPKTEIELDMTMTETRFELSKSVILADAIVLSALGASELREVQLPRALSVDGQSIAAQKVIAPTETGAALRLTVIEDADPPGTITLTALLLPEGTKVWVSHPGVPDQYRISLEIPEKSRLNLQVSIAGTLQVIFPGAQAEQVVYKIPRTIQMQAVSNLVDLDLTLPEGAQAFLAPHLPVQDLAFVRIDQFVDTTGTYIRQVSTVQSGTLYFTELNSREYPLRIGEGLQFEQSDGQMRTLEMEDGQLALKFHGYVRGMTTGWEESPENLMPSWLEWLSARHGLTLLWGTTLYIFGVALGVLRWWRK
jgi:hypothetical protein